MATIRRLPSGHWQAQVARKGIRRAKSYRLKTDAQDWAHRTELAIPTTRRAACAKKEKSPQAGIAMLALSPTAELRALQASDAYLNDNHPQHDTTVARVREGWKRLYPG